MGFWGKMIFCTAGAVLGGPIGAAIGVTIGTAVDSFNSSNEELSNAQKIQLLFFRCLAKVAKSDGRVSDEEIAVVETIMKEGLELDEASRKVAISIFREAKDSNTSFEEYLTQLASLIEYDLEFGKFLLYAFYQVATADGSISSQEKQMLLQTERTLRLIPGTVEELLENSMEPETAYQLLGCSPEMTDEEIKRIYRQKSLQFHPDQIRNKGLSSEFIEFANSQQAKINAAYEKIMSSRTSKAL
ncbi:TerB family tellurite resistance protein [Nostoc sp. FACHB-973]|nr:TerB family tellurite resistance protein [Nostoc sp. FACHB-973]